MDDSGNLLELARHVSEMADDVVEPLPFKPISGDSHIAEPPSI